MAFRRAKKKRFFLKFLLKKGKKNVSAGKVGTASVFHILIY